MIVKGATGNHINTKRQTNFASSVANIHEIQVQWEYHEDTYSCFLGVNGHADFTQPARLYIRRLYPASHLANKLDGQDEIVYVVLFPTTLQSSIK